MKRKSKYTKEQKIKACEEFLSGNKATIFNFVLKRNLDTILNMY